mgnify:CR=1 FL=1
MERSDTLPASFHFVKRDMHVLEHNICHLFESKGIEDGDEAGVSNLLEHLKLVVIDVAREAPDGDLLVGRSHLLRDCDMVIGTETEIADPLVARPWRGRFYATVCLDRESNAPRRLPRPGSSCSKRSILATIARITSSR